MALSKLEEFLASRELVKVKKVTLFSEGKSLEFKLKSMTREEYNSYQKASIKLDARNGETEIDQLGLSNLIIANHCLEPDFSNNDFLKKLGGGIPLRKVEAVSKCLTIGEADALVGAIMDLSGINNATAKIEEDQAKKS